MKWRLTCELIIALVLSSTISAQTDSLPKQNEQPATGSTQREIGLAMLDRALANSHDLEPVDRVSVQFLVSYTLSQSEPRLAAATWESSYKALRQMRPEEVRSLFGLAPEIVRNTALLAPMVVEEQMPDDRFLRAIAAASLAERYASSDLELSMQMLAKVDEEPALSNAADTIIGKVDLQADPGPAVAAYLQVLRFYENTGKPLNTLGYPNDLAKLTLKYWKSLPKQMVLNAIDVLMSQAEKLDSAKPGNLIVIKNLGSGAHAASVWQYRALQLIPVVNQLNPSLAEQWSKSLGASLPADLAAPGDVASVNRGNAEAKVDTAAFNSDLNAGKYFFQVLNENRSDPDAALAQIRQVKDPAIRASMLLNLARNLRESSPGTAIKALREFKEGISSAASTAKTAESAAEIAIELGDMTLAKDLLKIFLSKAEKDFAIDTDSSDPNLAPTLFWPSVHEWRDALQVAFRISPNYARELLKDVPQGKVRMLEEAMLAGAFLNVTVWNGTSPMVDKKSMHKARD
jgi:hypothetical protein